MDDGHPPIWCAPAWAPLMLRPVRSRIGNRGPFCGGPVPVEELKRFVAVGGGRNLRAVAS